MAALSVSPDGCHAIVAGRELLRLVDLNSSNSALLDDAHNVVGNTRRRDLNLNSNDVQWRPEHNSHVATGTTTGDVLLWDT